MINKIKLITISILALLTILILVIAENIEKNVKEKDKKWIENKLKEVYKKDVFIKYSDYLYSANGVDIIEFETEDGIKMKVITTKGWSK